MPYTKAMIYYQLIALKNDCASAVYVVKNNELILHVINFLIITFLWPSDAVCHCGS